MYSDTGEIALLMSCAMPLAIWPERAQAFVLQHRLLALPQVVVGALQRAVELRLVRGQRHVLAELLEEFAVGAGEGIRFAPRRRPARRTRSTPRAAARSPANEDRPPRSAA